MIKPVYYWKKNWQRAVGYLCTAPIMLLVALAATVRYFSRYVHRPQYRFRHPVIVIGSILAGGTGKTPLTQFLAEEYYRCGFRPAVISSGYRKSSTRTLIVSDGTQLWTDVRQAGDEAMMMAKYFLDQALPIPVVSGKNRIEAIQIIESRFDCNRIFLDDGLQCHAIRPDISIATLDAERSGQVRLWIPWGYRRDTLFRLKCMDWVIITKQSKDIIPAEIKRNDRYWRNETTLDSYYIPQYLAFYHNKQPCSLEWLQGKKIVAFSGLAFNESFRTMLETVLKPVGATLIAFKEFYDHYWYTSDDMRKIFCNATEDCWWVTTEKDAVKIQSDWVPQAVRDHFLVFVCRTVMEKSREWIQQIEHQLTIHKKI